MFSATTAAVFNLLLAGLSLAGKAVALLICMPLFLVFSPVLIPAGITATVLASGLPAEGPPGGPPRCVAFDHVLLDLQVLNSNKTFAFIINIDALTIF